MHISDLNLLAYQQIFDSSHLPGSTQRGQTECGTGIQSVNKMPEGIKSAGWGWDSVTEGQRWPAMHSSYLLIQAVSWVDAVGARGPCRMLNLTWTFVRGRWCYIRLLLSMLQQQNMLHSGFLHRCDSTDFKQLVHQKKTLFGYKDRTLVACFLSFMWVVLKKAQLWCMKFLSFFLLKLCSFVHCFFFSSSDFG